MRAIRFLLCLGMTLGVMGLTNSVTAADQSIAMQGRGASLVRPVQTIMPRPKAGEILTIKDVKPDTQQPAAASATTAVAQPPVMAEQTATVAPAVTLPASAPLPVPAPGQIVTIRDSVPDNASVAELKPHPSSSPFYHATAPEAAPDMDDAVDAPMDSVAHAASLPEPTAADREDVTARDDTPAVNETAVANTYTPANIGDAQLAQLPRPVGRSIAQPVAPQPVAPQPMPVPEAAPAPMPVASNAPVATPAAPAATSGSSPEYVLGTGDQIRLTVYGEDDLSGTYEIGSTGIVALPLIGNVPAANTTIRQFEDAIRTKLSAGYLQNPHVNVQVMNYRPFFILGEVAKPGSYPFVNGMTVLNAVALAGGYTYRAQSDGALIVRANDSSKTETRIHEEGAVSPGDIIRIPERFF